MTKNIKLFTYTEKDSLVSNYQNLLKTNNPMTVPILKNDKYKSTFQKYID